MLPEILWCPPPNSDGQDARDLRRLISDANVSPGAIAAAAVRVDGVFHAFSLCCGGRRPASPEPILGDEWYDLASVTKSIFALVVARMVRQGRMRFDAPLASYLSWARGTPAGGATVEALLAHRAGLQAHIEFFAPLRDGQSFCREEALLRAACATTEHVDANAPLYSDLGYLLLGEAVRTLSGGEALGDVVLRELHALGLSGLSPISHLRPALLARVVPTETVEWRGGEICAAVHDDNAFAFAGTDMCGHAGLFGTATGVLKFACALLDIRDGRHPTMAPESLEPLLRRRSGGTLRAGFDGKSEASSCAGEFSSTEAFGHLGFTGTSFWCDPNHRIAVVLLSNRVCPTRDNARIKRARPLVHDLLTMGARTLRNIALRQTPQT